MKSKEQAIIETNESSFTQQFLQEQQSCTGGRRDFLEESALANLPYFRRLDSFAILFEYLTNCAGVVLIGDQLCFAANKITFANDKFNRNALNKIVTDTMNYFSLLAKGESELKEMREQTFKMICSHQRVLSIKKPSTKRGGEELKINIKKEDVNKAIESVLAGNELSIDDVLHNYGPGTDKIIVHHTASVLYKHFKRIEKFIIKGKEREKTSSLSEKNLLMAIRNNQIFFLSEPEHNVHVELQLIVHVLNQCHSLESQIFYLGLSKLCCLDCNAMLFAVNSNKTVKFLTNGWNNIKQPWDSPQLYWAQLWQSEFPKKIQETYEKKLEDIVESKEVDIAGGLSDSETSSIYSFEIIQQAQLEKLKHTKDLLQNSLCLSDQHAVINIILVHVLFAEFLFEDKSPLQQYYISYIDNKDNETDSSEEEAKDSTSERGLIKMLSECQKQKVLTEQLATVGFYDLVYKCFFYDFVKKILQDKSFVGLEIAEHFKLNSSVFEYLGKIITRQPIIANITALQQVNEKSLSSKDPLIFSAPANESLLPTIKVNNNYLYEDNDITAILFARLLETIEPQFLGDQKRIQVLAAVDGMHPGQLERQLKANRDANPEKSLLLIPYNLGRNHWIGLLLEFNNDNELVRAEYMNSLGRGNFAELQNRLQKLYPICSLVERHLFKQNDFTSCGAYTIENLLLAAQESDVPQPRPSSPDIRRKHLECLKEFRPDFHRAFYERQRDNRSTVLSLNSQLGYSDRGEKVFTVSELKKILDIGQYINQISSLELQNQLWEAFKPNREEQDDINLHYTRIRKIIKNIATKLNDNIEDQKCFENLVQTLFNVGWQIGTNLDIDKADFWITYEQIEAIANRQDINVNSPVQTKINDDISTQIKKDEELALQLQKQIDEEYRKTKFSVSIN